jgi:hypothetical protein
MFVVGKRNLFHMVLFLADVKSVGISHVLIARGVTKGDVRITPNVRSDL